MSDQLRAGSHLNWLLDNLVANVPGIQHAIVLSQDGLPLARSGGLERDEAEHLSAVASGLQSLSRGAARRFQGGHVRQTVIEMDHAFLFVTSAGEGAQLAVLASDKVDAGMAAYEMTRIVQQVGDYLSAAPRADAGRPGRHP
ncbi:roadblock/LC7 domain-containing protein [Streptomyces sp. DSM 44917]|uniref:Roadblock/LC7 domain-containing protein n=1 Tax=Streptomyces boetiae TaxID=3075541 RepID=A0ABU2L495_9ACTN|nr:roadblock/LC7 domain-containing protein [Streptomyces sp. DSM 44917]MDT0306384.1 roadblock/LC7 domain-containing protein [Streptomyces sp. DSM 44917]